MLSCGSARPSPDDGPQIRDRAGSGEYLNVMASGLSSPGYHRVIERRRAVALAHHFREAEGLSIAEIAGRLGRSPTTIEGDFDDPTREKARAVKAR